ncbi:MAG TPA: hypothetical protein VG488_11740 [Candidatus Angelobacter sp.]|nr:hypothetical protein [Candidatus Angelobacter sp.]
MAIFAMLVLVASMSSAVLMAAGAEHSGRMKCHRTVQAHHCHDMENMAEMAAPDDEAISTPVRSVTSGSVPPKCPMSCCKLAPSHTSAAPAVAVSKPVQAVISKTFHRSDVIFTHNGFSSHTDRGPPSRLI